MYLAVQLDIMFIEYLSCILLMAWIEFTPQKVQHNLHICRLQSVLNVDQPAFKAIAFRNGRQLQGNFLSRSLARESHGTYV